ncbi:MAG: hypothetical protein A2139_11075, partial [Desulfobacca sp. RBG_16_60_12]
MVEICIHGRGGQGVVLAAELLVVAAFETGEFGQAFPAFGGERRGAPVQAFVRLDRRPIRMRHPVNHPDYVVVLDPSLLDMLDVLKGLKPDGLVLVNSEKPPAALAWSSEALVHSIPATHIAREVFGQHIVNSAMLGALSAATGEVNLGAIQRAFQDRFPGELGQRNSRAAQLAYDWFQAAETAATQVTRSRKTSGSAVLWDPSEGVGLGAPGRPLHFAAVVAPRTALAYPTGGWRFSRPVVDQDTCTGCGLCQMFCPDGCLRIGDKVAIVDYVYCKG